MEIGERKIVQLAGQVLHAQAVGDGGVYFVRFQGDPLLFLGRQGGQGPHIMQAVGQLDEDHPQVLRQGEDHFAQILHPAFHAPIFDPAQLGHPVDQEGDLLSERAFYLRERGARVFHHVMQKPRGYARVIQPPAAEYLRGGFDVQEIRVVVLALLSGVGLFGQPVGAGDDAAGLTLYFLLQGRHRGLLFSRGAVFSPKKERARLARASAERARPAGP